MGVLFAILGLVFAAFAVVALFVGAHLGWIYGHLAAAVACWVYAGATSAAELRELITRDASRRTARYGGNVFVQTVAFAVILGLVAWLSVRYSARFDWTEGRLHSLTEGSVETLEKIDPGSGVEILAFFLPGSEGPAEQLLDLYRHASERLSVRVVDPQRHPDLAARHEVRDNGVIVVCGGSCDGPSGKARVSEPTEQGLTRAIRSVISSRKKVYFVTGHGEADPDDREAAGASLAKQALEGENLEVGTLVLAADPSVPDDAAALVLAGPERNFLAAESEALDRFAAGGGALLVLADPIVQSGLEPRVSAWGVELGSDVVIDQQLQLFAGPTYGIEPIVSQYGSHPVTEKMRGRLTQFHMARSVRAADGADGVELASTSPGSWAETNVELFLTEGRVQLGPEDRPGPVALAVARTLPGEDGGDGGGRLIVVGDSDFMTNRYFASGSNGDLFLNMVNWLAGEEQFITVERRMPRASSVAMTVDQFFTFRYVALFLFPELMLVAGIWIWWRRRT